MYPKKFKTCKAHSPHGVALSADTAAEYNGVQSTHCGCISAVYGTKEYEYRMTVMLNGKVCREFPWQSSRSFILPIEYVGEYEVIVEVRDVQQGGTDSMTSEPISAAIAQTRHGYPFDSRLKWFLEVDGAEYISMEFDDQFEMYETDSLLITDAAGNVRRYADTDLAGQTIALRGSICRIALSTPYDDPDYDCGCYGFRVTDLKAITQDEYQALNNLWISDVSVTPSYASLGEELSVSVDADYDEN